MRYVVLLGLMLFLVSTASSQTPPTRTIPVPERQSAERARNIDPGSLAYLIQNPDLCRGDYRLRNVSIREAAAWEIGGASMVALALEDGRSGLILQPNEDAVMLVVIPDSVVMSAAMEYRAYWRYDTELVLKVSRPSEVGRYVAYVRGLLWRDKHGDYLASTFQYLAVRPGEGGGPTGLGDEADDYYIGDDGNVYRRPRGSTGASTGARGYPRQSGRRSGSNTRQRPGYIPPF